jgi:DNA replication protein DnaC
MNLQQERISAICEQLKLDRIAADWSGLAQEAARNDASFGDFLERLLNVENDARKQRQWGAVGADPGAGQPELH